EKTNDEILELLTKPNDLRLFAIAEAFGREMCIEQIMNRTHINFWFLRKIERMVRFETKLSEYEWPNVPKEMLIEAKRFHISDLRIAELVGTTAKTLRDYYKEVSLQPAYKLVDTCAGEFDAVTPYYYSTWQGKDEVEVVNDKRKVLVLGSGPIRIGQGVEFDYCSVHAAWAVKEMGYEAIVINNNPETVSTDYSIADRLYAEPLALEDVLQVIEKEQVEGVLIQFGGQTAINLANDLKEEGIHIFGTLPEHIDQMEDREQFYELLNQLSIPHISGHIVHSLDEVSESIYDLGFPVLIRPSYVIGGQSMFICNNEKELYSYVSRIQKDTNGRCWPLLIDQYLPGVECEIDVISDGTDIVVPGIFEHIERAGVHSGDSMGVFPPISLTAEVKQQLVNMAKKISQTVPVIGMMNIQFVIHKDVIYVLEVNPRSSRTIPIMSKVTGVPMVEWAVKTQLGHSLREITNQLDLLPEPTYYTVKSPIFSASKLKGVDHVLGPEMKSTGEIIGLGYSDNQALQKVASQMGDIRNVNQLFVSISNRLKEESLPLIQKFVEAGSQFVATEGTAKFLETKGIYAFPLSNNKNEIFNYWKTNMPDLVLNIPNQGREKEKIGFYLRELAVRYQIPYFTSLETLDAMVECHINEHQDKTLSLQEYLESRKSKLS
ncbi:carbamoyl-phosphate synthase large subunit, partial [Oceanobacillus caeni]